MLITIPSRLLLATVILSESDLVSPAGTVDRSMLFRIAAHRARHGLDVCARRGIPTSYAFEFRTELKALWMTARTMAALRRDRAAVERLPVHQQVVHSLELRVAKLRYGLALPFDPRELAHAEKLLTETLAAKPSDPAVRLAALLNAAA